MSRSLTSPQEIQAKLNELASLEPLAIEKATVKELRKIAAGLVSGSYNMRKDKIVQELQQLSNQARQKLEEEKLKAEEERINRELELKSKQSKEEIERLQDEGIVDTDKVRNRIANGFSAKEKGKEVYKNLRESILPLIPDLEQISAVAYSIGAALTGQEISAGYSPSTIKSRKTDIKESLRELVEQENDSFKDYLKLAVGKLIKNYDDITRNFTISVNESNKQRVAVQCESDNRVPINPIPLIEKAKQVLSQVKNNKNLRYQDVVIALAIATGRRQAEILSTGTFNYVDESTLVFTGQAKGRASRELTLEREIEITTLVDAQLVMDGMDWLDKKHLRLLDPEKVNDKYAKPLSREMDVWSKKVNTKISFKDLRAIYALCCHEWHNLKGEDFNVLTAKNLGHDKGDITTAHSYRKFKLLK